ncbi:MAG: imidazole glycerol phosphate synthase subunit HisH [Deltaproteobacteria bacterium]
MIAVVDYGMGNLRSVAKALEHVGADVKVTAEPADIAKADAVVLPGVGAFGRCMDNLREAGLDKPVKIAAASGRPFLGICVGMQILFEESEEFGPVKGLGILPGRVRRFSTDGPSVRVPHIGWNELQIHKRHPVLKGVAEGARAYFVHSYYVDCPVDGLAVTTTVHGGEFVSAVERGSVFATQFHPEKSQAVGLRLLDNFAAMAAGRQP